VFRLERDRPECAAILPPYCRNARRSAERVSPEVTRENTQLAELEGPSGPPRARSRCSTKLCKTLLSLCCFAHQDQYGKRQK